MEAGARQGSRLQAEQQSLCSPHAHAWLGCMSPLQCIAPQQAAGSSVHMQHWAGGQAAWPCLP
jgi:hypothetical protein